MKKYFPYIFITVVFVAILALVPTHAAHASVSSAIASVLASTVKFTWSGIMEMLAYVLYAGVTTASFGLSLCAAALNVSIYLTTNLSSFINNTPAIYTIWEILRDISTIFLIFLILFAAIEKIIGLESTGYANTLKNIIVAGILINFSFFFTTVLIDASNLVSLQLYSAIAPQTSTNCNSEPSNSGLSASFMTCAMSNIIRNPHGGLADIVVQSLDVTQWWGNKNQLEGTNSSADTNTRMVLINAAGIFVIVLTGLSFLGAAAAAIWRIVALLMLLAFSPFWIAGYALPQIKSEISNKWVKHLKANLIFLPVYLLLMYVVLTIIQSLNLAAIGQAASGGITGTTWYMPYIELFTGFTIILFLINMPLVTAISISGAGGTILEKFAKNVRGAVGGVIGRNTLGRWATSVDKSIGNTRFGNLMAMRDLRSVTTQAVAGSKFGGGRTYADIAKEKKDVLKKSAEIKRRNQINAVLGSPVEKLRRENDQSETPEAKKYKEVLNKMSFDEKLALGKDNLKDPNVLRFLKKDDFDKIKSSDMSQDDRDEISKAREDAFKKAIADNDSDAIKDFNKNMQAGDLMGIKDQSGDLVLKNENLIAHLNAEQLKGLDNAGLDSETKQTIGKAIYNWKDTHGGKSHISFGAIKKNAEAWGVGDLIEQDKKPKPVASTTVPTNPPKFRKTYS